MDKFLKKQYVKVTIAVLLAVGFAMYELLATWWTLIHYLGYVIFYGAALVLGVIALYKLYKKIWTTDRKYFFRAFYILVSGAVVALVINLISVFYLPYYYDQDLKIKAFAHDDFFTSCTLQLKNNGKFRLVNSTWFDGYYTYGKYRIENDTIYLSTNKPLGKDFFIEADKMLIEADKLYFIDNKRNEINNYFEFNIINENNENNR